MDHREIHRNTTTDKTSQPEVSYGMLSDEILQQEIHHGTQATETLCREALRSTTSDATLHHTPHRTQQERDIVHQEQKQSVEQLEQNTTQLHLKPHTTPLKQGREQEQKPTPIQPETDTAQQQRVFNFLYTRGIRYTWYEHAAAPTIEIAMQHWHNDGSKHCKNLFFRNHKGNRHYLVVFDCAHDLAVRDLEQRLGQGKLTFASEQRMEHWLGLRPGSVSPFGLINDPEHHVHLFLDANLQQYDSLSFHPNDNRATVVITREEFMRYITAVGNPYEFIRLY